MPLHRAPGTLPSPTHHLLGTDSGFVRSVRVPAGGADAYPLPLPGDIPCAAVCQTLQEVQGVLEVAQFSCPRGCPPGGRSRRAARLKAPARRARIDPRSQGEESPLRVQLYSCTAGTGYSSCGQLSGIITVKEGITENGGYIENCDFARFWGSNAVRTAHCRGDRGGRNRSKNRTDSMLLSSLSSLFHLGTAVLVQDFNTDYE